MIAQGERRRRLQKGLQKGQKEGLNKRELIGEIRLAQKLLGLPQTSKEELFALARKELQRQWSALESRLPQP